MAGSWPTARWPGSSFTREWCSAWPAWPMAGVSRIGSAWKARMGWRRGSSRWSALRRRHGRTTAVYAGHLSGPGGDDPGDCGGDGEIAWTGSGSADLNLLGTYRGDYLQGLCPGSGDRRRGGERHLPVVPGPGTELAKNGVGRRRGGCTGAVGGGPVGLLGVGGGGGPGGGGPLELYGVSPGLLLSGLWRAFRKPSPRSISTGKKTTTG